MYNLFVSWEEEEWNGDPLVLDRSRCVTTWEYTDAEIVERFGQFSREQVRALCSFPCVFAYEEDVGKDPRFGVLRSVNPRSGERLEMEYRLMPCEPFASANDLKSLSKLLDIKGWELRRSHWAVKDVDLSRALGHRGIELPGWAKGNKRLLDISRHRFEVALSFPGEHRAFVERVAIELEQRLVPNACFYDKYYEALLARPNLDVLLQDIYGERSDLVVAFVCAEYDAKEWCGIEWQKIRERRVTGNEAEIMYVRLGEGDVKGMSRLDGYLDAQARSPDEVASLIVQRLEAQIRQAIRRPSARSST